MPYRIMWLIWQVLPPADALQLPTVPPLFPVFLFRFRQFLPLHIIGRITATGTQADNVVNHITWAGTRFLPSDRAGVLALEFVFGGCAARCFGFACCRKR